MFSKANKFLKSVFNIQSPILYFVVAFFILLFDQLTKYLIKSHVNPFEVMEVLPFFNIVYVENVGAAFGLFKELGRTFFIAVASAAVIIISIFIIKDKDNRLGFSFILGGAAGNLTDRVTHGYVIDFLDIHVGKYHWPAFNIADSALTVGVLLIIIQLIFHSKRA